ncbi:MAG: divalent metal cation transporter [Chloroflexi bacterium]|nr:MAG: divalent metal cation transporter [Chloroflexota bacterium]
MARHAGTRSLITDPIRKLLPTVSARDPSRSALRKDAAVPSRPPSADRSRSHPLLGTFGPGLITGASDDDPSGIGTCAQVGSQFGYGFLWTPLFTLPLMTATQEICARIALQTGEGLGSSLRRRFPAWLVAAGVALLVVANTINAGADLGAMAAAGRLLVGGAPAIVLVFVAALLILGFQLFSTYQRLVSLFKWLTVAVFAYVVTLFAVHPDVRHLLTGAVLPSVQMSTPWLAAVVAILGTTISPYLFFWQATTEVGGQGPRRRRRPPDARALRAARADVVIGMALSQVVMFCIIATSAAALHAHGVTQVRSAAQAANALQPLAGRFASTVFALGIIGTGLLAVPILTGSAAYAVREVGRFRGGLEERLRYRPTFYSVIVVATLIGVLLNLIGFNPMRALFVAAMINGLIAPPLLVLINVVACDRRIMGARVSGRWSRVLGWSTTGLMSIAALGLLATTVAR